MPSGQLDASSVISFATRFSTWGAMFSLDVDCSHQKQARKIILRTAIRYENFREEKLCSCDDEKCRGVIFKTSVNIESVF